MPQMGPPEDKSLEIDKVSQNRLNIIEKKSLNFALNSNKRI